MSASAPAPAALPASLEGLPEQAAVPWRRRIDDLELRRRGRGWTLVTLAHSVPFLLAAALLVVAKPILAPVALILVLHAWVIPDLYANRGANVLRPRAPTAPGPEATALLLLGDLVSDEARTLHATTGLVVERHALGVWVVGEAGALLVRPGGHRVNTYCVTAADKELPRSDRIAHLLLALRCDEAGFATVANLAFSGATWRLRRRLPAPQRAALVAARTIARR